MLSMQRNRRSLGLLALVLSLSLAQPLAAKENDSEPAEYTTAAHVSTVLRAYLEGGLRWLMEWSRGTEAPYNEPQSSPEVTNTHEGELGMQIDPTG